MPGQQEQPAENAKAEQLSEGAERSDGTHLTTNTGMPIEDDQNQLKAGPRGPVLMEDSAFREKMMHFDHERIPERVVHPRGSGAHGYFQVYEPQSDLTRAAFLQDPSVKTPVFFIHRRHQVPRPGALHQARTAPRDAPGVGGPRQLLGLRVPDARVDAHDHVGPVRSRHPPQLPDDGGVRGPHVPTGERRGQVPLHQSGTGSRCSARTHWCGTQKIAGKDPDFNRRDLWESIEAGDFPEFELGIQVVGAGIGMFEEARLPDVELAGAGDAATVSDQGVVTAGSGTDGTALASEFLDAISAHRHWGRDVSSVSA